ncbi:MAG: 3D domain-containing protein [Clostridium fessum]
MLLPRHRKQRHLLKSTPDVLRQLLTAAAADAAVAERTALNPAPFRRQDIPFPPTCAYSRSELNYASTALSHTVEDSGSGIRGNKLDIFFNSHSQALQYGKRSADVYIVR